MRTADYMKVESDERGFELHIRDDEGKWYVFNVHALAETLHNTVRSTIGPWLAEAAEARRTMPTYDDDEGPWPGEPAEDYYKRTGDERPLLERADTLIDQRKGK